MEGPYWDPADPPGSNRERPGREGRATGRSDRQGSARQGSDRQGSWVTTQLAYILVVCGCVAGLAIVASDHFKRGGALIAATIFVGAVARLVLPEHRAGMLANRSRLIDVVTMTTVAVTLGFAAAWLPPPQ
jgi:hypothetical protein